MTVTRLLNGSFEATVLFGVTDPQRFQYKTRKGASDLVDAERIYKLLNNDDLRAECSNGQIHAAADAVLHAPCGNDAMLSRSVCLTSRWIRSWSEEARLYS